jgi:hypothetical protein
MSSDKPLLVYLNKHKVGTMIRQCARNLMHFGDVKSTECHFTSPLDNYSVNVFLDE